MTDSGHLLKRGSAALDAVDMLQNTEMGKGENSVFLDRLASEITGFLNQQCASRFDTSATSPQWRQQLHDMARKFVDRILATSQGAVDLQGKKLGMPEAMKAALPSLVLGASYADGATFTGTMTRLIDNASTQAVADAAPPEPNARARGRMPCHAFPPSSVSTQEGVSDQAGTGSGIECGEGALTLRLRGGVRVQSDGQKNPFGIIELHLQR